MNYRWRLNELLEIEKNSYKVFSCFSCGGGSSMGYKLAGFDVIGNIELDPRMAELYKINLEPRYSYIMDIKEFNTLNNQDLPKELFDLDILDGSPPCSTFSMAGKRSQKWGKEYKFKEGQKLQRLDTLFFDFLVTVEKLQPKVVIAENVKGLLNGHAKGYVSEIVGQFRSLGYNVQIFQLNAARMGVPQTRERVFFIAGRQDCNFPNLKLEFNEPLIPFREIKDEYPALEINPNSAYWELWQNRKYGDRSLEFADMRIRNRGNHFSIRILYDHKVPNTITSSGRRFIRYASPHYMSDNEIRLVQSFPEDYNFLTFEVKYVCGMSVPPIMMGRIAEQLQIQ